MRFTEFAGPLFLSLAAYEALASATRRPTLSELIRTPLGPLVWASWLYIGLHLLVESLRE